MRAREAVADQEKSFTDVLAKRGLSLRTDLLKPLVNWLSPDFAHRRFNTRYFAATVPVNQQPSLLASKGVWGRWVCVRKVIAERDTTALGDEVGQENTVGLTLGELLVPGSEIMLEKMAAAQRLHRLPELQAQGPRLPAEARRGGRQAHARGRGGQDRSRRAPARTLTRSWLGTALSRAAPVLAQLQPDRTCRAVAP